MVKEALREMMVCKRRDTGWDTICFWLVCNKTKLNEI